MTNCPEYPCGTYTIYQNSKCRGDACREASRLYTANRRRIRKGLEPLPVLAEVEPNPCELPRSIYHDQRWTHEAACADLPSETFFEPALEKVAISICRECKVIEQCLTYAKATDQKYGVWGGRVMTKARAHEPAN